MRNSKLAFVVLALCCRMCAQNAVQPIERYNSPQSKLLNAAGRPIGGRIAIRDWQIHGQQEIDRFPEVGTLIVQLQSGKVTTTIGGATAKREPGEHWTVPAGIPMAVKVTSESAILHVVSITK